MIIIALEVTVSNTKTIVSICIPALQLDEIMQKYTTKNTRQTRRQDVAKENERRENIMQGLHSTKLEVKAILSETKLELADLLALQVNDIIPLNAKITDNVIVKVGQTAWFDGKLGVLNGKKAIQIENKFGIEG
jgi:flagellar motor switch protein FliM